MNGGNRDQTVPSQSFDGRSILIVEDNLEVREIAVAMCCELGFRVSSAGNAQEALRCLAGDPGIGILFADVLMAGMKGDVLAREVLTLRPEIKIVLTTGHPSFVNPDGGFALLRKPYRTTDLVRLFAEILRGPADEAAGGICKPQAPA